MTCSHCGRTFVNIDESLIGQQARCTCGAVVKMLLGDPELDRPELLPTVRPERHRKRLDLIPQPTRDLDAPEPAAASEEPPLVADAFSDLDAILEGAPDSRPLPPPAQEIRPPAARKTPSATAAESSARDSWDEPIGVLPTLALGGTGLAAASGLLMGCWGLAARIAETSDSGLSLLLAPLQQWYQANLGDPLSATQQTLLVVTGWLFTLLSGGMLLVACGLLLRCGLQFFANYRILGWCRGVAASLAVASLLTVLGGIFLENAHYRGRLHTLDTVHRPIEGLVEDLGNVKRLRQQYTEEHLQFRAPLLVLGSLPGIVLVGTLLGLLLEGSDRAAQPKPSTPSR